MSDAREAAVKRWETTPGVMVEEVFDAGVAEGIRQADEVRRRFLLEMYPLADYSESALKFIAAQYEERYGVDIELAIDAL
jgi:hypothetical protein